MVGDWNFDFVPGALALVLHQEKAALLCEEGLSFSRDRMLDTIPPAPK